jgi:hypothetical protein
MSTESSSLIQTEVQEEAQVQQPIVDDSKRKNVIIITSIIISVLVLAIASAAIIFIVYYAGSAQLSDSIEYENIEKHLKALEEIAKKPENRNSRSVLYGYTEAAEYIINTLKDKTDCKITTQELVVPIHEQVEKPRLLIINSMEFLSEIDFIGLRYAGNGMQDAEAELIVIEEKSGCNPADFVNVENKYVMVMEQKECTEYMRILNAQKAGAVGVLIRNNATRTSLLNPSVIAAEWNETCEMVKIPALSVSYLAGEVLKKQTQMIKIISNTKLTLANTFNIFCDVVGSDPNVKEIVVAGAHLDSVPGTPGINDNGSGVASLLEMVIQLFKMKLTHVNHIKFAWWAAEEIGLMGSKYYVKHTRLNNTTEFNNLAAYINLDMIASPNYIRAIITGDSVKNETLRRGHNAIRNLFETYFNKTKAPYDYMPFVAGSDYYPFAEAGIPANGISTGGGGMKTEKFRSKYGGMANVMYDACNHQACDTLENIHKQVLVENAKSAAYVLQELVKKENIKEFLFK